MNKKDEKKLIFIFLSAEGGVQSIADMSAKKSSFFMTPPLLSI